MPRYLTRIYGIGWKEQNLERAFELGRETLKF